MGNLVVVDDLVALIGQPAEYHIEPRVFHGIRSNTKDGGSEERPVQRTIAQRDQLPIPKLIGIEQHRVVLDCAPSLIDAAIRHVLVNLNRPLISIGQVEVAVEGLNLQVREHPHPIPTGHQRLLCAREDGHELVVATCAIAGQR